MIGRMQDEAQALVDSCVAIAYWMRGGAPYNSLLHVTPGERARLSKFIETRLEHEKKNPYPSY